jgi:sulfoxide reductase heme-binding subunit YedZ
VRNDQFLRRVLKPLVFVSALTPAGYLTWAVSTGNLSANPLGDITNGAGDWALRFLCVTLGITPLRRVTGWSGAIRFRRMLGLFAFFYGGLHFLTYVILDRFAGTDLSDMDGSWVALRALAEAVSRDISKRPFIAVGFTAFALMIPLAVTSTTGMIRRLGGRRWQALHRLTYVSCIAAVLHYWWLVRADVRRPVAYGAVIATLLAFRLYWTRFHGKQTTSRAAVLNTPLTAQVSQASRRKWSTGVGEQFRRAVTCRQLRIRAPRRNRARRHSLR